MDSESGGNTFAPEESLVDHLDESTISDGSQKGKERTCERCNYRFVTKGVGRGNYRLCPNCRTEIKKATTEQSTPNSSMDTSKQLKRNYTQIISPSSEDQGAPKKESTCLDHNYRTHADSLEDSLLKVDERELSELTHKELIQRTLNIAYAARKYQVQLKQTQSFLIAKTSELEKQKQLFQEAKLAFADKVIAAHTESSQRNEGTKSYAAAARGPSENHKHNQTTVAFKINRTSAGELNVGLMDKLLKSKEIGNPIPLRVNTKDDKGFITFQNQQDADKALDIIRTSEECKAVINDPRTQEKLYPAIGLFVPIENMDELKEDINFRNSFIEGTLQKIVQIHKCNDQDLGHVKMYFSSAAVRDEALSRNKIHTRYKLIKIVPIDVNREVRRCYKCNNYGHTSSHCKATAPTCGKCSSNHDSRSCNASTFKCPNCKKNHTAGDPSCPDQINAVKRYRQLFNI